MIDYADSIPDLALLSENRVALQNKRINFANPARSTSNSEIPDKLRRFIASKPTVCISAAFVVGGLLGWLTSKR